MKSAMQFANKMLEQSAFLRSYCTDREEFEDPLEPLPTLLLGYFGSEIAAHFDAITPQEWRMLVTLIEDGLAGGDKEVGDAVATGLLEAMVNHSEDSPDMWHRIEGSLGSRAKAYIDAYRKSIN